MRKNMKDEKMEKRWMERWTEWRRQRKEKEEEGKMDEYRDARRVMGTR
jgi:hypothetical protein